MGGGHFVWAGSKEGLINLLVYGFVLPLRAMILMCLVSAGGDSHIVSPVFPTQPNEIGT